MTTSLSKPKGKGWTRLRCQGCRIKIGWVRLGLVTPASAHCWKCAEETL